MVVLAVVVVALHSCVNTQWMQTGFKVARSGAGPVHAYQPKTGKRIPAFITHCLRLLVSRIAAAAREIGRCSHNLQQQQTEVLAYPYCTSWISFEVATNPSARARLVHCSTPRTRVSLVSRQIVCLGQMLSGVSVTNPTSSGQRKAVVTT